MGSRNRNSLDKRLAGYDKKESHQKNTDKRLNTRKSRKTIGV